MLAIWRAFGGFFLWGDDLIPREFDVRSPFPRTEGRHPSRIEEDTLPASGKTPVPHRGRHPSQWLTGIVQGSLQPPCKHACRPPASRLVDLVQGSLQPSCKGAHPYINELSHAELTLTKRVLSFVHLGAVDRKRMPQVIDYRCAWSMRTATNKCNNAGYMQGGDCPNMYPAFSVFGLLLFSSPTPFGGSVGGCRARCCGGWRRP